MRLPVSTRKLTAKLRLLPSPEENILNTNKNPPSIWF
jgi:hypothetical protein